MAEISTKFGSDVLMVWSDIVGINNHLETNDFGHSQRHCQISLPLDEAIASRAVFVIVSGSDGRAETLLEPAK